MKNAHDYVKQPVEYDRPIYDFPSLSSEQGNAMFYWKDAISHIYRAGFRKEAEDIKTYYTQTPGGIILPKINYEEQFDFLNKFLNFEPRKEQVEEDEEYVYIKIKKTDYKHNALTKQPTLFYANNREILESMYECGEDFSINNCYGRNIFHYCNDIDALSFLLEKNKEHRWVDLFSIDFFKGTILHTHDNFYTFPMLLKAMHDTDPDMTKIYFHSSNVFGQSASDVYCHLLDRKLSGDINVDLWNDFANSLQAIKLVDSSLYQNILNHIEKLPFMEKMLKQENHFKGTELYSNYRFILMDLNLDKHEDKVETKRKKI